MKPTGKAADIIFPQQRDHPAPTISEHEGVRYLHLGTEWVQGAMRLARPEAIELEYVQQMMMWMLFEPKPGHIVQLGLGSGALTKFCHRHFPHSRVTAVDLNPAVIAICRSRFGLPPDDGRLTVLEMDAADFVHDPSNRGAVDILQIDLYDEKARKPVLDTAEFYQACADCLTPTGMMTVNLFGEDHIYDPNIEAMLPAFDAVAWLPEVHEGNVVVIAFKLAPYMDFGELYVRASQIRRQNNLTARSWVDGLKVWMAGGD